MAQKNHPLDFAPPATLPAKLPALRAETEALGFQLASTPQTGCLLRTLAATKPSGTLLELGTGTGVGTVWLLDGMDNNARLISIDNDARLNAVARRHLGDDARVTLHTGDAAAWLPAAPSCGFDLIFADTWAGKYTHLDEALRLLRPGALYVVDDLLPQADWPEEHQRNAAKLVAELTCRPDLKVTSLDWSSGIIVAAKAQ